MRITESACFLTIYRPIFNLHSRWMRFLTSRASKCCLKCEYHQMMVVIVAWNEENLIRKQIELTRKHLKDEDWQLMIVDNSSKAEKRKLIQHICKEENITYLPAPKWINILAYHRVFFYGMSHGTALNWMFYHYLQFIKPKYFALIDHDCLPGRDYNLTKTLDNKDFYGVDRLKDNSWYIWPGFAIYRYSKVEKAKPNFLPIYIGKTFLDAGGANYLQLYQNYQREELRFAEVQTVRIQKTKGIQSANDIYHADCIQRIDNAWIHIINGSNYAKLKGKEKMVKKVLEKVDDNKGGGSQQIHTKEHK